MNGDLEAEISTGLSATRRGRIRRSARQGSILVFSVVLIALFSVIVYTFSVNAVLDVRQSKAHNKQVRQRLVAESVMEMVLATTSHGELKSPWDRIIAINGASGTTHRGAVQFPNSASLTKQYGLFNESAKLNINYLVSKQLSREIAIDKLAKTPGLDRTTATAIVDYLRGSDDSELSSDRGIADLSELLAIPGVTEELLYGRDLNRDGLVDSSEWARPVKSIGRGLNEPSLGWSGYWTVLAGESTRRDDGTKKIRLNQADLAALYDQLIVHMTPDEARFVLAWRLAPAKYNDDPSSQEIQTRKMKSSIERKTTFEQRLLDQSSRSVQADLGMGNSDVERAGIRIGLIKPIRVTSLVALCQCSVQIAIDGEDRVLVSPFPNNARDLSLWLERLEEIVTLADGEVDRSRINIQQASYEMLMTVSGMTESLAHSIIRMRESTAGTSAARSTSWLLDHGLVTWSQYRRIANEITTGGSVVSGIAVGQLEQSRTATRVHFMLDHRMGKGRWIYRRELEPTPAFLHESISVGQTR